MEILLGYPVNRLIEFAAADIRPIMVRQVGVGLHMVDAISRMTSGRRIGVFCKQHGPGTENADGGVAQAFAESVPILVVPGLLRPPHRRRRRSAPPPQDPSSGSPQPIISLRKSTPAGDPARTV